MSHLYSSNCYALYLQDFLKCILSLPDHFSFIILEDFNLTDINWCSFYVSTPSTVHLCDVFVSLNLCQLVDTPTHQKGNLLQLS